jgi:hypothetical protein
MSWETQLLTATLNVPHRVFRPEGEEAAGWLDCGAGAGRDSGAGAERGAGAALRAGALRAGSGGG